MSTVKDTVEIWLHIHAFRNAQFEVSANGSDAGRVEIPASMVDRFHTDASRPGKALFRVPEYLVVGLGVYKRPDGSASIPETRRVVSGDKNQQSILKTEAKPILDEGDLYKQLIGDVYESHNNGDGTRGFLDRAHVIRTPVGEAIKESRDLGGLSLPV